MKPMTLVSTFKTTRALKASVANAIGELEI